MTKRVSNPPPPKGMKRPPPPPAPPTKTQRQKDQEFYDRSMEMINRFSWGGIW